MSQNGPTYIIWNLTKNGSLLPKITHICGKETKFQNRIDTPGFPRKDNNTLHHGYMDILHAYCMKYVMSTTIKIN